MQKWFLSRFCSVIVIVTWPENDSQNNVLRMTLFVDDGTDNPSTSAWEEVLDILNSKHNAMQIVHEEPQLSTACTNEPVRRHYLNKRK